MLWRLMLRNLFTGHLSVSTANRQVFRLRAERRKTHRSRPSVKPELEILKDRVLLSASPGAVSSLAETTTIMAAARNEETQLIVTVQQDVNTVRSLIGQAVAEETALAEQEIDQVLGIRGSGSGSGAASTADNNQNQSPQTIKQSSGRGSGSGAVATAPGSASTSGGHKLPRMNSGTGSGTPSVYFDSASSTVYENGSGAGSSGTGSCPTPTVNVQVDLSAPSNQSVSVNYSTGSGTALAGTDYTAESGSVTFAPGQTVQYIHIPILDDGGDESATSQSQYFDVTLSNPSGAYLGTPSLTVVYIAEPAPQGSTDTLVWNPMCGSTDASNATNWYDQSLGRQLMKGDAGPGSDTPIIFDGTPTSQTPDDDSPITWDDPVRPIMELVDGYNQLQIINPGDTLELTGKNGTSLSMDGTSWLKLKFADSNSTFKIDANATITNMVLSGNPGANFQINGGTTVIAQSPGYAETIGVNVQIASGATLKDYGYNSLKFTNTDLSIHVDGVMDVYYGTGTGLTLIDNNGFDNDYIDVDYGTLYYGGASGVKDTFTVPVLVEYIGTFRLSVAGNQTACGTLIVKDTSNYVFANGSKESVYVTGQGASVQLAKSATLQCDDDYYQASGTLETTDTTKCTLQDGSQSTGTATIAGGSVIVAQGNTSYGTFDVECAYLEFYGELHVAIAGYQNPGADPGQSDVLQVVNGELDLFSNSVLVVRVDGQVVKKDFWVFIKAGALGYTNAGGNYVDYFFTQMTSNPQTNLNDLPNQPAVNQYEIVYPGG